MKRIGLGLLCFIILLFSAAGCTGAGNKEESTSASSNGTQAKENVAITLGNWPTEAQDVELKAIEDKLAVFTAKYPGITVNKDTWLYDTVSFLPKAASGQLPTVYKTWFTEPKKIIGAGYAADVTDTMREYGWDKAVNPQVIEILSDNNRIYGVPLDGYIQGLNINVKLFKDAGLVDSNGLPKYPQTYEELAQFAQQVKEKTGKAGFGISCKNNEGGWQFMNIAWSFGTEFEKKVDGKWQAAFNSPEGVAALQFIKDLKWKYAVLPDDALIDWSGLEKLYATDQLAMRYVDMGDFGSAIDAYQMSKDSIAIASVPAGPKGRFAQVGGTAYMFAPDASPEQLDACFKWLEVLGVSPDVNEDVLKAYEDGKKTANEANYVVAFDSLPVWINEELTAAKDKIRQKYVNVNLDLFKDYMDTSKVTMHAEEPMYCQELYKALDNCIQEVLVERSADPGKLLDEAAKSFQKDYLDKVK